MLLGLRGIGTIFEVQQHGKTAPRSLWARTISGYNQYGYKQSSSKLLLVQDIQKQIGARMRALRLQKGWSQDVFADRSGLHRAHVGEIERGEQNVTIQTLKTIADTLGVRILDLVHDL
jgi:ribosome-binding protein aMBF1 (putative translation factor)